MVEYLFAQHMGSHGPADRLIAWAWSVSPDNNLDNSVVDLSATTLAWMFTTPNRLLRDKASKALVSLLAGRHDALVRLLARFATVDDSYVVERLYAVVYGVVMQTHETREVSKLASCVYQHVFASGSPPSHILLRDYAAASLNGPSTLDATSNWMIA